MSSYGLPPAFMITEMMYNNKGSTQKFSGWSLYSLWKYTVYKIMIYKEKYLMESMTVKKNVYSTYFLYK